MMLFEDLPTQVQERIKQKYQIHPDAFVVFIPKDGVVRIADEHGYRGVELDGCVNWNGIRKFGYDEWMKEVVMWEGK